MDLKKTLSKSSVLIPFGPNKILYIDIDASHKFGFGVVLFHNKIKMKTEIPERFSTKDLLLWPTTKDFDPIMFLNRLLTPAERNYWPTELETAGLVWTVKKVWHLIESLRQEVRVQINHSSIVDISRQKLITVTTSTIKMNGRLIRVSQFLSQFSLSICHKPGRVNVIPDALSRLPSNNTLAEVVNPKFNELDALYTYNTTLVEIDESFATKICEGYDNDPT